MTVLLVTMTPMEIITAYLVQIFSLKTVKIIVTSIIAGISFMFWNISLPVVACGVLYIADMIFGLSINVYRGTFSWIKLKWGIFKFILYWAAIIVGHMLDLIFVHTTPEFWARYVMIIYLGVTEGLSVLKHLASLWLHIPTKLINRLEGVRDDLNTPWQDPLTVVKMTTTSESQTKVQSETVIEVTPTKE